ncbi:MAG: GNAT family N-acetyltransferase [Actinobacteria bacterium]|nr:GNAT family N-acetyltransferase [Actinomycetota bacterium]
MTRPAPVGEPDLLALRALLRAAGLPDDVGEHRDTLVAVARDGDVVVGGVAVEIHDGHGLLRSLVVDDGFRSMGIGRGLVAAAEAAAGARGLDALTLLTEGAAGYFEPLGYQGVARDAVPGPLQASSEFAGLCPDDATAMTKPL